MANIGINELNRDTYPISTYAHAALDDVASAELFADLPNIGRCSLVGKRAVAGNNREGAPKRKRRDYVFSQAVAKVILFSIAR